ncbi:MAG: chromosomal replication initiator DnaA [Pseudomonadota bacterium]
MSAPRQLPLDLILPRRRTRGRGDFLVSASNSHALAMIDGWADWPAQRLALTGPEGAGKTHLAHVWMAEAGAEKIAADALTIADVPALVGAGALVVEDVERMSPMAEPALFHLMNLAAAERCYLLITGRGRVVDWPIVTPDLASRLAALSALALAPPDDALLRDLLAKLFADRELRVPEETIRYIATRIDRSAAAAVDAVARLDEAGLTEGQSLTRPFIRRVLGF